MGPYIVRHTYAVLSRQSNYINHFNIRTIDENGDWSKSARGGETDPPLSTRAIPSAHWTC